MSSWFTGYSHYLSKIKVNQYALDFRFTTMVPSYQIQFQLSMFNDARSAIFNNFAPVKKSFVFMPIYLYATNNNFIPDIWKTPGINFNILSEGRHLSTLISLGMTTGSMYNFFDHWDDQTLGTDPQPATDSRLMYLELNTTQEFTLFDKAWIAGLDLWATPTQSKMVTNSKGSMTASIGRKLSPAVTFSVSYQTTLPHHYGKLYAIYDEAYTSGDLDDEAAVASYAKMNALNDMSKRHHIGSLTATLNF